MKQLLFVLFLLAAGLHLSAQQHDTITSPWVVDTTELYSRSVKDLRSTDTLTIFPSKCIFRKCCLYDPKTGKYCPKKGYTLGLHYDYASNFKTHSGGISLGKYFRGPDLMVELEYQTDRNRESSDLGISVWKNLLYVPVEHGMLSFPLLRPGIKIGRGNNPANSYLFYELKMGVNIPFVNAHLYYGFHSPINSEFIGYQMHHQFGLSYYFVIY